MEHACPNGQEDQMTRSSTDRGGRPVTRAHTPEHAPMSPRPWWFLKRALLTPYASTLLLLGATILGAIAVDYLAPWPFLMTPLYAIPLLIATSRLPPRGVGAVAALVMALNFVSGLIQNTPFVIVLLYTSGLLMTTYLGIALAWQRQLSARHAREAEWHAREAERHAQDAEAAHQRLQQFLGMVTHDLSTPLSALLGYLQWLRRSAGQTTPEKQQWALSSIESAATRMCRLVDDLRDAEHTGVSQFVLRRAPLDLTEIVRRVVALQQSTTASHHLILDAPEHLEAVWDGERLGQLLANLISNAIKYSPAGGDVRVTVREVASEAVVSVSDQGIGLSRAQIERLFQPFTRLYSGREIKGTGLGLYICKAIVEAHGGRIWVESTPDQGSTFTVTLPCVTVPPSLATARIANHSATASNHQ
jgi:signal transduction histidine kinase